MRIGMKEIDVVMGGIYHDMFYDRIVVRDLKVEKIGGYLAVTPLDSEINFNWIKTHKDNIKWENLAIYVELPVSFKTTLCPSWLPNYQHTDENGDLQTYTLEEYGKTREDNLAGTKWIFKATNKADKIRKANDLTLSQLNSLIAFVDGNPNATGMLVQETRDLLNGVEYTVPE